MDGKITEGPDSETYVLQAEIASNTDAQLSTLEIVEGISRARAIARILSVFSAAKEASRSPGAMLYSLEHPYSISKVSIPRPTDFINTLPQFHVPLTEQSVSIRTLINERTKRIIDKEVSREFKTTFGNAMGYYCIIAEHLYQGNAIYEKLIFSDLNRIITLDFVFDE